MPAASNSVIRVVGERCYGPKEDTRLSTPVDDPDQTWAIPEPYPYHYRHPSTRTRAPPGGKVAADHNAHDSLAGVAASASLWPRSQGQHWVTSEEAELRHPGDLGRAPGMRVKIAYVDVKGRVHAEPRARSHCYRSSRPDHGYRSPRPDTAVLQNRGTCKTHLHDAKSSDESYRTSRQAITVADEEVSLKETQQDQNYPGLQSEEVTEGPASSSQTRLVQVHCKDLQEVIDVTVQRLYRGPHSISAKDRGFDSVLGNVLGFSDAQKHLTHKSGRSSGGGRHGRSHRDNDLRSSSYRGRSSAASSPRFLATSSSPRSSSWIQMPPVPRSRTQLTTRSLSALSSDAADSWHGRPESWHHPNNINMAATNGSAHSGNVAPQNGLGQSLKQAELGASPPSTAHERSRTGPLDKTVESNIVTDSGRSLYDKEESKEEPPSQEESKTKDDKALGSPCCPQTGNPCCPQKGSQSHARSLLRPATTCAAGSTKRVHFAGYEEAVRERLRAAYAQRRSNSACRLRASGLLRNAVGAVGLAVVRVRGRRRYRAKKAEQKAVVVDADKPPPVSRMFRKFRLVGVITLTLIRLKAAIVVNSLDRTERSAAEIQWRTLYGATEVEKLAFNKSLYSRERISTKLPNWALRILEVAPEERSEQDCRRLHALFRGMRSFDKFTEEIQLNLCRAFSYTCVGESRIVLRRGHVGHNFYFIYSGSVFVNVPDLDSEGQLFIKTEAILGRGDSFGELALLQDIRRTATISVREACELLVVDKDVFSKVCPKIFENELLEKKAFISRLSLFSPKWWTPEALDLLCMEAQIQEFKINKIVVENNTTEDWLYIIMEGKCQVIRCLTEEQGEAGPGGEGEGEGGGGARKQSIVLSEEIIELLSDAAILAAQHAAKDGDGDGDGKEESSKEKLLSSLGLEYVQTGKRRGVFINEVEEEERRKALLASRGPLTLTSLITRQQKEGRAGLVYVNVGTLEAEDVFDMGSLLKAPAKRNNGALLLVSSGARMLRVKKSSFHKMASQHAIEHTKTLVSKHPFPTEASIVESYRQKVQWNAYKREVVQEVMAAKDLRMAPMFRAPRKSGTANADSAAQPEHSEQDQRETQMAAQLDLTEDEDQTDLLREPEGEDHTGTQEPEGEDHTGSQGLEDERTTQDADKERELAATIRTVKATKTHRSSSGQGEQASPIFPVAEVDAKADLDMSTPRIEEEEEEGSGKEDENRHEEKAGREAATSHVTVNSSSADSPSDPPSPPPPARPTRILSPSATRNIGRAPADVIIRRRSSVGLNQRPLSLAHDATFVTRRRRSRDEDVTSFATRFAPAHLLAEGGND